MSQWVSGWKSEATITRADRVSYRLALDLDAVQVHAIRGHRLSGDMWDAIRREHLGLEGYHIETLLLGKGQPEARS